MRTKVAYFKITDNIISAKINSRMYVGEIWKCGNIISVISLRSINAEKQTTANIKCALEIKINS